MRMSRAMPRWYASGRRQHPPLRRPRVAADDDGVQLPELHDHLQRGEENSGLAARRDARELGRLPDAVDELADRHALVRRLGEQALGGPVVGVPAVEQPLQTFTDAPGSAFDLEPVALGE